MIACFVKQITQPEKEKPSGPPIPDVFSNGGEMEGLHNILQKCFKPMDERPSAEEILKMVTFYLKAR